MTNEILIIQELSGGYKKGSNIIHNLSLTLQNGEALGVLGLNGSGKSTFGKALMNLLPYRSGEVIFNGNDITRKSTCELPRLGLTLMHQGGAVFNNLSVWDNLQLAPHFQDEAFRKTLESLIPILSRSKKELKRMMADQLSGGERHELALAMALAGHPKVVILDEPSAGLSPIAVESIYNLLSEIRNHFGISIILIEQNISRAVSFCDRCVMLEEGKLYKELGKLNINEIESELFNNK